MDKKKLLTAIMLLIIVVLILFVSIKFYKKERGRKIEDINDMMVLEDDDMEKYVVDDYTSGINDAGIKVSNRVVDESIRDENESIANNKDNEFNKRGNIDDVFNDETNEEVEDIQDLSLIEEMELSKDAIRKEVKEEDIIAEDIVNNPKDFMKVYLFEDLDRYNNTNYPNYKVIDKNGKEKYIKSNSKYKLVVHSTMSCSYCFRSMVTLETYLDSGFNQLDEEDIFVLYHSNNNLKPYNNYNYNFVYNIASDSGISEADFIGSGVPRWYLIDENNNIVINGIGTLLKTQLRSIDQIITLNK